MSLRAELNENRSTGKHPDGWAPGVEYDIDTGTGSLTLHVPFGQDPNPAGTFAEMLGDGPPIPVPLERLVFEPSQFRAWQAYSNEHGTRWLQYWRFTIRDKDGPQPWQDLLRALEERAAPREPLKRLKPGKSPRLFVVMGDDQAPHYNRPLHEATCEALADMGPDGFVYTGDGTDFDSLSSHAPDTAQAFVSTTQQCIDTTHRVLDERLDAAGPGCTERIYLKGNHEDRLDRQMAKQLPELFGIRRANVTEQEAAVLSIANLLRLPSLGVDFVTHEMGDYPHGTYQVAPRLQVSHGWLTRKGAGASARASIEHLNSGIVVGHTHRLAVSHMTRWNPDGTPQVDVAAEAGTMGDPRGLQYAKYPDWQPGWLSVTVWPDGSHHVDLARWDGSVLRWRDREWRLTKTGVRAS